MNYYLDIHILPDPEFKETVLMNAVYTKLHKALCDLHSTNIGVSFPNHQLTLGNTLRIHGTAEVLDKLQRLDWIGPMSSYCQQSDIHPVPPDSKFRTVSRQQPTMSPAKLKRLLKRGSITDDEVKQYKVKMFTKGLDNPYLELVSGSNGQRHRRYIEFGSLLDSPIDGAFDQFGLSKTATIPWF
jgi:CRISPR-associated endonuclease Csy4